MNVFEGMYGTSKSSYLKLEHARMIVRHSAKIDESKMGARGRYVESIFVENGVGERFMFPTNNLAPARAMTQHINQDGSFADQVGQHILRMAEDYANLSQCSRHVFKNSDNMNESVMTVRETCRTKMQEMRKVFERMSRATGYMTESQRIMEMASALNENEVTDAISSDEIEEMREAMMVEGVEPLSDAIIESVCKCMKEDKTNEDWLGAPDDKYADKGMMPGRTMPSSTKFKQKSNDDSQDTYRKFIPGKPAGDRTYPREVTDEDAETVTKPAKTVGPTVSVLGVPGLSVEAWESFKDGYLKLSSKPFVRDSKNAPAQPTYVDKTAEILVKLGNLLPLVEDDGMRRLLTTVSELLDKNHGIGGEKSRDLEHRMQTDPNFVRKLRAVAAQAVKIADQSMDEGISGNNAVVREFTEWMHNFSTDVVLSEDYRTSPPGWDEDGSEDAVNAAISHFDAKEFYDSAEAQDMLAGRNGGGDPEDSHVEKSEIVDALETYLRKMIEQQTGEYIEDVSGAAQAVCDAAVTEFETHGIAVSGEDIGGASMAAECMDEDAELSREDILLPRANQGENLGREVLAPTVDDPRSGVEQTPDGGYIDRLKTLAGLNSGV